MLQISMKDKKVSYRN